MNELNVIYASSDLYSSIAGVSILSLLEKNQHIENICFYILSYDISELNKEKLRKTIEGFGKKVIFVDMEPYMDLMKKMKVASYKSSIMIYMKFFIAHYIPKNVKRIIYVDSDTYFTDKVDEWLEINLHGKVCAMSQDCIHKLYKRYIGMDEKKPYFNSGLIIFDLNVWREKNIEEKILNHIRFVKADYPLVDQDLLNIVIYDEIYEISIKNNLLPAFLLYRYKYYKKIYGIDSKMLSKDAFNEGKNRTVMHHFSGNSFGRPWFLGSKHPLAKEYMECWQRSEWKDIIWGGKENVPLPYKIQCFLHYHTTPAFSAWCGYWMQRIFMKKTYGV